MAVSEGVASNFGLTFSISPAKHKPKKDDDDEEYVLTLAPFTKTPKINFGQVKLNNVVERRIVIINPQQFDVTLSVTNHELNINNFEIHIDKLANIDFNLQWRPIEPGSYKYSITFEVTNCARLKFLVHAFGVCPKPEVKPVRKPLTHLQPLKPKKEKALVPVEPEPSKTAKPAAKTLTKSTATTTLTTTKSTTTMLNFSVKSRQNPEIKIDKENKPKSSLPPRDTNLDDIRRKTCVIASPKPYSKNSNSTKIKELYGSSEDLTINSTSNIATPSYIEPSHDNHQQNLDSYSFVDNTVIFLAGASTISMDKSETLKIRQSPSAFSTLRKLNYEDDDEPIHESYISGIKTLHEEDDTPSTPKLSDFTIQSETSKKIASTKLIDISIGDSLDTPKYLNNITTTTLTTKTRLTTITSKITTQTPTRDQFICKETFNVVTTSSKFHDRTYNIYAACNSDDEQSLNDSNDKLIKCVIMCQRNWRMKQFRRSMRRLKNEQYLRSLVDKAKMELQFDLSKYLYKPDNVDAFNEYKEQEEIKRTNAAILFQRIWRMKKFREALFKLKMEYVQLHYIRLCQKWIRMKQFRKAVNTIKMEMKSKEEEAIRLKYIVLCQNWRRMKQFRSGVAKLKEIKAKEEHEARVLKFTIFCQRLRRMKQFKKAMDQLRENKAREEHEAKVLNFTILCQKWRRMKQFRKALIELKQKIENERLQYIIICQRLIRMKQFRRAVENIKLENKKKEEEALRLKCIVNCQKWYRLKQFRKALAVLKEEKAKQEYEAKLLRVTKACQMWFRMKQFRKAMVKLRENKAREEHLAKIFKFTILCQKWRRMKQFRNGLTRLKEIKAKEEHEANVLRLTILCQRSFRMKKFRKSLTELKIKRENQRLYLITQCQKWVRMKQFRLALAKLREQKLREEQEAKLLKYTIICQRSRRLKQFRKAVLIIKQEILDQERAALVLKYTIMCQRWRRMKQFRMGVQNIIEMKFVQVVIKIQRAYRMKLFRRRLSALKHARIREISSAHEAACATKIQAYWRGYRVRKEMCPLLNSIRNRLSIYIQNWSNVSNNETKTLGARIRNSLNILSYTNVPIHQIVMALIDLDKVTRLSPECCKIFANESALDILYMFIANCNRSVPHMDLIKICLQIFINLAKYSETVVRVLKPSFSLNILLNLLHAYQSSNPNIFMDVCIVFILLNQHQIIKDYLLAKDVFIKKLQTIHSVLHRRAIFKNKNLPITITTNTKDILNSTTISSVAAASSNPGTSGNALNKNKSVVVCFSLSPDWSLCKKKMIELVEPIGALEYLMNLLGIETVLQSAAANSTRTPKKLNPIKERYTSDIYQPSSASKNSAKLSVGSKIPRINQLAKSHSSHQINLTTGKSGFSHKLDDYPEDEFETNDLLDCTDDHFISICGGSNTNVGYSINESHLGGDPRMNSTSIQPTPATSNNPTSSKSAKPVLQALKNTASDNLDKKKVTPAIPTAKNSYVGGSAATAGPKRRLI